MKTYFSDQPLTYDGSQLRSLYCYETHQLRGDSICSWIGPCKVSNEYMVDGEDLFAGEEIRGAQMLHFIVEVFGASLKEMVTLQRLLSALTLETITTLKATQNSDLHRTGDDIYLGKKKLSISIATVSPVSGLIHFAMNCTNEGTPVETLSLGDLDISPIELSRKIMDNFVKEYDEIVGATQKVKWVK